MAELPFNIEPPRWLQSEEAWAKESPMRSLAMEKAKVNLSSGLLGLQEQEQGLALNQLKIQQMSAGSGEVHDWMAASNGDPVWMVNHPYTGTNPMAEAAIGKAQIRASQSLVVKKATEDMTLFNKRLATLRPDLMAGVQALPDDPRTKMPSAQKWKALTLAEGMQKSDEQRAIEQQQAQSEIMGGATTVKTTAKGSEITVKTAPTKPDLSKSKFLNVGGSLIQINPDGSWKKVYESNKAITPSTRISIEKHIAELKADPATDPSQIKYWQDILASDKSTPAAKPTSSAKTITDAKGAKWNYTGTMADPKLDKDPSHWKLAQ